MDKTIKKKQRPLKAYLIYSSTATVVVTVISVILFFWMSQPDEKKSYYNMAYAVLVGHSPYPNDTPMDNRILPYDSPNHIRWINGCLEYNILLGYLIGCFIQSLFLRLIYQKYKSWADWPPEECCSLPNFDYFNYYGCFNCCYSYKASPSRSYYATSYATSSTANTTYANHSTTKPSDTANANSSITVPLINTNNVNSSTVRAPTNNANVNSSITNLATDWNNANISTTTPSTNTNNVKSLAAKFSAKTANPKVPVAKPRTHTVNSDSTIPKPYSYVKKPDASAPPYNPNEHSAFENPPPYSAVADSASATNTANLKSSATKPSEDTGDRLAIYFELPKSHSADCSARVKLIRGGFQHNDASKNT